MRARADFDDREMEIIKRLSWGYARKDVACIILTHDLYAGSSYQDKIYKVYLQIIAVN